MFGATSGEVRTLSTPAPTRFAASLYLLLRRFLIAVPACCVTSIIALSVSLAVTLELPAEQAQQLVTAAHQVCPYSNAVKGNIDVQLSVNDQPL